MSKKKPRADKLSKVSTLPAFTDEEKRRYVAEATDTALAALTGAFFEAVKLEGITKRDLQHITGMHESAVGHILAGRRKNLTLSTIAVLARALKKRVSLKLDDLRPTGNQDVDMDVVHASIRHFIEFSGAEGSLLKAASATRPRLSTRSFSMAPASAYDKAMELSLRKVEDLLNAEAHVRLPISSRNSSALSALAKRDLTEGLNTKPQVGAASHDEDAANRQSVSALESVGG